MLLDAVTKFFHDTIRRKLEEHGIASSYRRIIFHLAHNDGISQSELVNLTHLSAPTISVTLDKMEREGVVTKKTAENDGRQSLIFLTEKGEKLDETIRGCHAESEKELLCGLPEEEQRELHTLLLKMSENIEENFHPIRREKNN